MRIFRFFRFTFILALFSLVFILQARAEMKIATVDVDALFDSYYKTVELNQKMEDEIQGKQAERGALVQSIRKMKDELVLLADTNKRDKQAAIDRKIKDS